jgi:hypothetical protein
MSESESMFLPRARRARTVIIGVLATDAILGFASAVLIGRPDLSRGTALDPYLWGAGLALPFIIAIVRVASKPGVERTFFAQILGCITAFLVPFFAYALTAMSWSSDSMRKNWSLVAVTIGFGAFQLLIPAAVRWARKDGNFAPIFLTMVAILGIVFAYATSRL